MSSKAELQGELKKERETVLQQRDLLDAQDRKIKEQIKAAGDKESLNKNLLSQMEDYGRLYKNECDRLLKQNERLLDFWQTDRTENEQLRSENRRLRKEGDSSYIDQIEDENRQLKAENERLKREKPNASSRVSKENSRLKAENRKLASDRKEAIALVDKIMDCCLPVIRDVLEDDSDFCKKWMAFVTQWNAFMKKEG